MILNKLDILTQRKIDPSTIESDIYFSWSLYLEKFRNTPGISLVEYFLRANQGLDDQRYSYSNDSISTGIDLFLSNTKSEFKTMLITDCYRRYSYLKAQMNLRNLYLIDAKEGYQADAMRGLVPNLVIIHVKHTSSISFPILYNMDHLRGRVPLIKFTDS